ncbi:hypothetical protein IB277_33520 [Ensifer sp. ENS07]|uniref:hypothetical protein n=1 Tax=unclassified Ensifer TaxID=2633371 RepID=UPI001783CF02|nr:MULTISPECIES: hypothetical protein [unclassified Ensifer]MBD9507916.1 hypothetical protein [Ensifer sp. ENS10]MBD9641216.1 hypothetical protein [Ensifer sp. ENS07]
MDEGFASKAWGRRRTPVDWFFANTFFEECCFEFLLHTLVSNIGISVDEAIVRYDLHLLAVMRQCLRHM